VAQRGCPTPRSLGDTRSPCRALPGPRPPSAPCAVPLSPGVRQFPTRITAIAQNGGLLDRATASDLLLMLQRALVCRDRTRVRCGRPVRWRPGHVGCLHSVMCPGTCLQARCRSIPLARVRHAMLMEAIAMLTSRVPGASCGARPTSVYRWKPLVHSST
jgi:hypothetical protein